MPNNQTVRQAMSRIAPQQVTTFIATITAVDVLSRAKTGLVLSVSPRITCNIHGINGLRSVELSQAVDPNKLAVGNQILVQQINDRYVAVGLMPITARTAGGGYPLGNDQNQMALIEQVIPVGTLNGEVLELTWEKVEGAQEYEIFRGTTDDPDDAESIAVVTSTRYTSVDPLDRTTTEYYFVIARRGMESSDISDPVLIEREGSINDGFLSSGMESTIGGRLTITNAMGILRNKVTTVDSPTTFDLNVVDPAPSHTQVFQVGDILKMRDKLGNIVYMTVMVVTDNTLYYTYSVQKESPGAGTNRTLPRGGIIVGMGQSGDGQVILVADSSGAPSVQVATHAGAPWSALTHRARLGKLNGITDAEFGALTGYGLWTDNGYFTGGVHATFGKIANWSIGVVDANTISADNGKVKLNSATPSIALGEAVVSDATGFDSVNKGIWMGKYAAADWRFRVGGRADGEALFAFDNTDILLKNAGIEVFNGATQTGNIQKNGSAWFGASSATKTIQWWTSGATANDVRIGGADDSVWWDDSASTMYVNGNVEVSGEFHTAVFVKEVVRVEAGTMIIAQNAGITDEAKTTAAGSQTLKIKDMAGAAMAAVNDRLRIKTRAGDNWFTVTAVGGLVGNSRQYTLTRNSGSNATFPKGTAVTNYGAASGGVLYLTSDFGNGPYYSVRTHGGSPWSSETEKARMGRLDGITDPTFGALTGFGLWTDNIYLTGGINATSGTISGVLSIGASGGFYQGTGTFGTPTTGLKIYNSGGIGLWELWGSGVKKVYANTSGQVIAGAASIDNNAFRIAATTAMDPLRYYGFTDGGTLFGGLTSYADTFNVSVAVDVSRITGKHSYGGASTDAPVGKIASWSTLLAKGGTFGKGKLEIICNDSEQSWMHVTEVTGVRIGDSGIPLSLLHVGNSNDSSGAVGTAFNVRQEYTANTDNLAGVFFARFTGTNALSVQGVEGWVQTENASGGAGSIYAVIGHSKHGGAGTATSLIAFEASNIMGDGSGNVTNSYNYRASPLVRVGTPGTVTNTYAFFADTMTSTGVTNRWAFYSAGSTDGSYLAGNLGIGVTPVTSGFKLEASDSIMVKSASNNAGFVARATGGSSASVGPQNAFIVNDGAAMANNDRLGTLLFYGYDGSAERLTAGIIVAATEGWTGSARGSKLTFYATTAGGTTLATPLVLTGNALTFADAVNIIVNATTGTKIGTATSQKIGFWNAAPVAQQTTSVAAATFTANSGTAVNNASTFDGYTIQKVVKALRNVGILA